MGIGAQQEGYIRPASTDLHRRPPFSRLIANEICILSSNHKNPQKRYNNPFFIYAAPVATSPMFNGLIFSVRL